MQIKNHIILSVLNKVIAEKVRRHYKFTYKNKKFQLDNNAKVWALNPNGSIESLKYYFDNGNFVNWKGEIDKKLNDTLLDTLKEKLEEMKFDWETQTKKKKEKEIKKIDWDKLRRDTVNYIALLSEKQLVEILDKASETYYNNNEQYSISDTVYDMVEEELRKRDPKNPRLKKIGAPVKKMGKVELPFFMPSLNKVKTQEELEKWSSKFDGPFVITDKLDGNSLGMSGNDFIFTRGDGKFGQDISHLLPYLHLPNIPQNMQIRTEFILDESKFKKLFPDAPNARNTASGLIGLKKVDPSIIKEVDIVAYEIIQPPMNPSKQLAKLKALGFKIPKYKIVEHLDFNSLLEYLIERRKNSKYAIDGLVIIPDEIFPRPSEQNPKYSIAFKATQSGSTAEVEVLKVEWQVSKHGQLTPVILVNPIRLSGVTISRVTGHNAFFIIHGYRYKDKDKESTKKPIGKGAILKIVRSGDVIPHVLEVIKPAKEADLPKQKFDWDENKVNIYLKEKEITSEKEVFIQKADFFFKTLKIKDVSVGIISKLYDNGYTSIPKIAKITKNDLLGIPGIQDKIASKIVDGVKNALSGIDMATLMAASGTMGRLLGTKRAKLVFKKYPDILNKDYDEDEIYNMVIRVQGFSDKMAELFAKGIFKFKKFLEKMPEIKEKQIITKGKKLANEYVLFTGFRDSNLSDEIEANGGVIENSFTNNVTILLAKDVDSESSKIKRARDKGIPIYTKEQFVKKYL